MTIAKTEYNFVGLDRLDTDYRHRDALVEIRARSKLKSDDGGRAETGDYGITDLDVHLITST